MFAKIGLRLTGGQWNSILGQMPWCKKRWPKSGLRGEGDLRRMIKFPGRLRLDGHIGYHMVLWGLVWIYIVSRLSERLVGRGSLLQLDGVLPITVSFKTVDQLFGGLARNLVASGKQLS